MRRVVIGILVGLCLTACERRRGAAVAPASSGPAAPASTGPAATGPVTVEGASVTIDGVPHAFPPTGVKLRVSGDRMTAVVYSLAAAGGAADETHAAMNLRFSFPDEDWEGAGSGVGHLVAANAGREESPFGLFLDDGETQLVPADMTIEVRRAESGDGRVARVTIRGRFVRKDLIAPDLPFATVSGEFDAAIEEAP